MLTEDYAPRAKCSIQRKDIAEAMTLADSVNLQLPGLSTNMKLWDLMIENNWAELDHSALLLAIDPHWSEQ
jgi:3-hydroxyisobutyrate dehydrogenase-like beta-hydroxyacid dehydrogenase